ncbi:sesquipedalian-1 [Planococcus citri]|uniref:sesquipedalian-1 n=1 Tax=Planococcus citri TaxID=170843 RepID=UPI0031F8A88F
MKINEKNLCVFAVSPTIAADKEGYLMKKGEVNKGFQKRWFVLKGNLLFYFEKRYDKEPLGLIILEGCTIELDENDAQFSFKIVFHGAGNRTYVLCADNQESMEQWMKSLACSSYDYMKSMVTELQRQLKETRSHKCNEKINDSDQPNSIAESYIHSTSEEKLNSLTSSSRTPQQSANSSPHPPPRHRQQKLAQSQSAHCIPTSKIKSPNMVQSSSHGNNNPNSHHNLPNQRNKISFKDMHTAFGRPVLSDRNLWRHQRKNDLQSGNALRKEEYKQPIAEQNLLISL